MNWWYRDLIRRLARAESAQEFNRAFDALLFERERAVPALAEAYRSATKQPGLRYTLVQLLGFSGDLNALPHLLEALDDPDPRVRAEACRALEDLGDRAAAEALARRVDDVDPEVREAAREALAAVLQPA